MSGYWRMKGWLTGCKNVFGSGSICLSLEEGTNWKSSRISAGAGMDRSREDTRPEGGRANQDRLEDREERLNVIDKSWSPWDSKEERSIICFVPGGFSGKESTCQCRRRGFDPWVRKIPWRRK